MKKYTAPECEINVFAIDTLTTSVSEAPVVPPTPVENQTGEEEL